MSLATGWCLPRCVNVFSALPRQRHPTLSSVPMSPTFQTHPDLGLWTSLHIALFSPSPTPNSLLLQCYRKLQSSPSSLFDCIGAELNRDGTPSDAILFHLGKLFVIALEELDHYSIVSTYSNIIKRHELIRSTAH